MLLLWLKPLYSLVLTQEKLQPEFQIAPNDFREQRLYTYEVANLLDSYAHFLKAVFLYQANESTNENADGLALDDFILLLTRCGLFNDEVGLMTNCHLSCTDWVSMKAFLIEFRMTWCSSDGFSFLCICTWCVVALKSIYKASHYLH